MSELSVLEILNSLGACGEVHPELGDFDPDEDREEARGAIGWAYDHCPTGDIHSDGAQWLWNNAPADWMLWLLADKRVHSSIKGAYKKARLAACDFAELTLPWVGESMRGAAQALVASARRAAVGELPRSEVREASGVLGLLCQREGVYHSTGVMAAQATAIFSAMSALRGAYSYAVFPAKKGKKGIGSDVAATIIRKHFPWKDVKEAIIKAGLNVKGAS